MRNEIAAMVVIILCAIATVITTYYSNSITFRNWIYLNCLCSLFVAMTMMTDPEVINEC